MVPDSNPSNLLNPYVLAALPSAPHHLLRLLSHHSPYQLPRIPYHIQSMDIPSAKPMPNNPCPSHTPTSLPADDYLQTSLEYAVRLPFSRWRKGGKTVESVPSSLLQSPRQKGSSGLPSIATRRPMSWFSLMPRFTV